MSTLKVNCPLRSRRKWLLLSTFFTLIFILPALVLLILLRVPPTTQIVLISPPVPSAGPMVHYRPNFNWSQYTYITQSCHIAEVQLRNLGPGSIVLPYRGGMSVEIQESGATNWIAVHEGTLGIMYKPTPAGETLNFKIRIPDSAERWRVSTSYYRWFFPQLLNYVLRDWLHIDYPIGDREEYFISSQDWQLPISDSP